MVQRTRRRESTLKLSAAVDGSNAFSRSFETFEQMVDQVTPGYFRALKSGAYLPVNPSTKSAYQVLNVTEGDWGYTGWDSFWQKSLGTSQYSGVSAIGMFGAGAPSLSLDNFPALTESDIRVLYTGALANVRTQGMDLYTFVKEFHKTQEMVTGLAGRVLKRANDIVKLKKLHKIKDKKEFINAFSDSWLEYRYGWRILAYEIEDIQALVQRLHDGISIRLRSKKEAVLMNSVRSEKYSSNALDFPYTSGGIWAGRGVHTRNIREISEQHGYRLKVGVMIESMMRSFATIDPIITAYELTPYSFVLDWFFTVQDWLIAVSPLLDERILHAFKTVERVKTATFKVGPDVKYVNPWRANEVYTPYGGSSSFTLEHVVRDRILLTPDEQQLKIGYVNNFDRFKAADAAALLWGRLRTLRRFTSI